MQQNRILLGAIVVLLVFIDFLTFHDLNEPHTAKDWLILAISLLTFVYIAKVSVRKAR